ncbi:MAG TPA: 16S rRNA (guanine(527)-N(7))-methyltransferase RsmG [Streptosporangiaceae bacterium]
MRNSMLPEPPPAAAALFGPALPAAARYVGLLAGPGVERGLIGPAEAARIWDRHLLNCAVVAELVPARGVLADLGSGAGLPGIVLALLRPECDVLLVESMARRAAFLTECVAELGLPRVQVVRGRAEDLAREISADIVTARAVAPLGKLAGWAVGLCRPGGTVLAIKGAGARDEVAQAGPELIQLGVTDLEVLQVGSDEVDPPATVVRFRAPARRRSAAGRPPGSQARKAARPAGSRRDRRRGGQRPPRPGTAAPAGDPGDAIAGPAGLA